MKTLGNEDGLALLSALLSVALLTLIVVEMTDATFVHSHLTRNSGNAIAAQLLARSGQIGAREALREARGSGPASEQIKMFVTSFVDAAPLTLPTARGHVMQIAIRDETGRLNLNDALQHAQAFEELFRELKIPPGLLESIQARIDNDPNSRLRPPSDDCALGIACDPPRGPLRSLDDVRTIRGFDDDVIAQLRPYVTAYPRRSGRGAKVNLRTARAEVLRAIGCDTESLPPPPRTRDDLDAWKSNGDPCQGATVGRTEDEISDVYSILAVATVGDATQAVESTVQVGRGPLTWKQRPVWGAGPVGVR